MISMVSIVIFFDKWDSLSMAEIAEYTEKNIDYPKRFTWVIPSGW